MRFISKIMFISANIIAIITISIIGSMIFSCISNPNDNIEDVGQDNIALSWQQIFLGKDYNRSINYTGYSEAKDYGDESTRKILWQNNQYSILGSTGSISDVYMENIEIVDVNNKRHNFPRDIIFIKSVVNGESIVRDGIVLDTGMGAGYDMQILPNNDVYDFDGDGIGDVFFGINQSGTRSKFLYYVMKMNAKKKKFECIGFEIGESWITEDYITTKIPLGYKVDMLYYILYPIKEYDLETYQLRQVFRLYSQTGEEMKNKEHIPRTQDLSDKVKGVFILDWQYQDNEWSIVGHNVNLSGKIQLGSTPIEPIQQEPAQ